MKLFLLLLQALTCSHACAFVSLQRAATTTITRQSSAVSSSGVITLDGEEIRGPITPVGNFILVKVKDTLIATAGGVLLPDQAKERPTEGLVMEAGPGKLHPHTGVRIHNPVKAGVSVLYGKYDGKPIEYKGEECQMIRDDDVMLYYEGVTMNLDNVVPCRDYVLVDIGDREDIMTNTGIAIANAVVKDDNPCEGIVIKVGEGRLASKGEFTPSPVSVGEKVKFKDYAGNEVKIEGKTYLLVRMVDILCSIIQTEEEAEAAAAGAEP